MARGTGIKFKGVRYKFVGGGGAERASGGVKYYTG